MNAFSADLAYVAAAAAGAVALTMLGLALILRALLIRRQAQRDRAVLRWRTILLEATDRAGELPRPGRAERIPVLVLWNQLHESVRGPMQDALRAVAMRAGFDEIALGFLRSGKRSVRLLALTTCGNLRLREAWNLLVPMTRAASPIVASAAARALVRVDRYMSVPVLVPLLMERSDLHPARIGPVLIEAGEELVGALAGRIPTAHAADQVRLVKLLEALKSNSAAPVVRELLATTSDDEIIAACLRVLAEFRDPRDAWAVRRYLNHPASFVRVQAAVAIGKLGVRADEPRLVEMLTDAEWWVRYRAAQALVSLPFLTREHLEHVGSAHPDRYARDALRQALAERAAS